MMLQVGGLDKSFDGFKAVDKVNLTVEENQIVAVIGPNGAGKTTLFNLITGQLKPDKGKIIFKGEDITELSACQICRKGIGRSFQVVNIFPKLTVFENVRVAVLSRQRKAPNLFSSAQNLAVRETISILERVNLLGLSGRISSSLSQGEKKLLELAVALGTEPELLVLDEPTAGLSPEETAGKIKLIKQLALDRKLAFLFCEHDIDVVFSIAHSIVVMHQGRSILQGRPEQVRGNREVQDAYLGEGK